MTSWLDVVVPEQLSSMPLLEMTEEQEDLLKHLPDAQHQSVERDAAIKALAAVPAKLNTAINHLFVPGQTLNEKVRNSQRHAVCDILDYALVLGEPCSTSTVPIWL